jgi:hypothetical protein
MVDKSMLVNELCPCVREKNISLNLKDMQVNIICVSIRHKALSTVANPEITNFQIEVVGEGAARTRAPAATNYDVYASRRKILESPGPKCNGADFSRPSTFWIMDTPRPGK